MIKQWRILFAILSIFLITSCNPLGKEKAKVTFLNPGNFKDLKISISSVSVNNNQLVITGSSLAKIKTATLTNDTQTEIFQVESASDSQIITNGIKTISLLAGSVFNLVLADAYGSATFQVAFTLADGSVTGAKLNSMGATSGQVLKWNGSTWAPASLANSQIYLGNWDASAHTPDITSLGTFQNGDYYIVSVAGSYTSSILVTSPTTFAVGDWVMFNGTKWDKINNTSNIVTSFQGRNGAVSLQSSDYVSLKNTTTHKLTGSSINDIADIDLTIPPTDGQILKWNTSTSKWEAGDDLISGGVGSISTTELANGAVTYAKMTLNDGDLPQAKINGLVTALSGKEPTITAGSNLQYYRGDKTFVDFGTDVRASLLTGVSSTTGTIAATDSVLSAFGKLINAQDDYVSKTANSTITGTLTINNIVGALTVPTPVNVNDAVNKSYVDGFGQWGKGASSSINYTAGNVGIGTNTPQRVLHIAGSNISTLTLLGIENTDSTDTNGTVISFRGPSTGVGATSFVEYSAIQARVDTHNHATRASSLGLYTTGAGVETEKLRITSSGNIGIGTTAPVVKLHTIGNIIAQSDDSATAPSEFIARGNSNTNQQLLMGYNTTSDYGSIQAIKQGTSAEPLALQPVGGNVGIGTATPTSLLTLASGTTSANGITFGSDANLYRSAASTLTTDGTLNVGGSYINMTGGGTILLGAGGMSGGPDIVFRSSGANPSVINSVYKMKDSAGSLVEGMRFNTAWINSTPGSYNSTITASALGTNIFSVNATTASATIDFLGNVGIGTASPDNKLDVSASASGTIGGIAQITNPAASAIGNAVELRMAPSAAHATRYASIRGINNDGNNNIDLAFVTGAGAVITEKMRVVSNGNVGIGTSSPTALLQVGTGTQTTAAYGIQIGSDAATNLYRSNNGVIKTDGWLYGASGLIGNAVQFNSMFPITGGTDLVLQTRAAGNANIIFKSVGTTPTETMRLDTNGNVGIGITAPAYPLDVNGTVHATTFLNTSDSRLKKDIRRVPSALEKVQSLRGVEFSWKSTGERTMGFIAQEVEKIFPDLVKTDPKTGYKAVQYANLIAAVVEAIKEYIAQNEHDKSEINQRIDTLENENKILKDQNKRLEEHIEKIEKRLENSV